MDLEWNQAYYQKSVMVQKQLSARLRGEVIQIGAVKLDNKLNICGSYSIIVKPKYFTKIHRHVMLLTGISQSKMDAGVSLTDAVSGFRKFCGDDYAFITWGPDDIPMLKENLNVNKLDASWLDHIYDLQSIYAKQILGEKLQASLEDAMERLQIPQTLPAHDALNDAYFTALVAKKLDIDKGIREYSPYTGKNLYEKTVGDADVGEEGIVSFAFPQAFETFEITSCPICGKKINFDGKTLHSRGQKYTTPVSCSEHGDMFLIARATHNLDDSFRIKFTFEKADSERIESYKNLLNKQKMSNKRKHYAKSKKKKTVCSVSD